MRRLSAFAGAARLLRMIILVCLCGCGYRPLSASLPNGVLEVEIPTVRNRTVYGDLSSSLTAALRRKAAAAGLAVRASHSGGAKLRVVVVSVNGETGMLRAEGTTLLPVDRVWRIEVTAELVDKVGNVMKTKRSFTASGRAYVVSNPAVEESLGRERRSALVDEIADIIVSNMFMH